MNDSAIFGMLGLLIGGAGVWAVMRQEVAVARHLADLAQGARDQYYQRAVDLNEKNSALFHSVESWSEAASDLQAAHSRLSDAHNTQSARIERALDQVTEGANATVVRMARILKGDA